MKKILLFILITIITLSLAACIDDSIDTSPSAQPTFSCDTLDMGTVITEKVTATYHVVVYNRNASGISISSINLTGAHAQYYRMNVDGFPGTSFQNVEIRGNDSIYVFVEATLPRNDSPDAVMYTADLNFVTNGVSKSVALKTVGCDVIAWDYKLIDEDTTLDSDIPYLINDSLVVAPGATLTIEKGTLLRFHDGASFVVRGTLVCNGTPDAPIDMTGDRTDNVVGDLPFDLMSRQWDGLWFTRTSQNNKLSHTKIRNTVWGVTVDSIPDELLLHNCKLTNSGDVVMDVRHSKVTAIGCEFSDASNGLVNLVGGDYLFNHCTFANYYLFSVVSGAMIKTSHINEATSDGSSSPLMHAEITNSILYGFGVEIDPLDIEGTQIFFRRCLLKDGGTDDDNYFDCLWEGNPYYRTVRDEYYFDYRVKEESEARDKGDITLNENPLVQKDFYGVTRSGMPTLGAYEYVPEEEPSTRR